MSTEAYTIDAKGRVLGRIASEAAVALRGKNDPNFERHILTSVKVKILNAAKMKIAPAKKVSKDYVHYSGYPGGLRHESLGQAIAKSGYAEPLRRAIYGMLPNNRLRAKMMTNLTIEE